MSEPQGEPEAVDPPTYGAEGKGALLSADEALCQRDPAFLSRQLAAFTRYVNYFSPEVRGQQHLPATGPVLVVGNHSNLFYMPDAWIVGLELIRRRGLGQPAYALGYDLLFNMPVVGSFLRRIGAIPADSQAAQLALTMEAAVVVYPGGDREASRPWTQRDKVDMGDHHGFVRLALRTGVPVVPVVTHGSHDAIVIVTRGERMAKLLGLHRLRIKVFPIFLTPFGLSTVLTPPLPMPSAITMEFLPPLDWSAHGPEAADDNSVVTACYQEITSVMQAALDRLHAQEPHPVLLGWTHLIRPGGRRLEVPSG
ncbi:MAG: 1-acyl-sn-glycerol-3-phosphate acyltransferase [Acidimicrobiales bacterium]